MKLKDITENYPVMKMHGCGNDFVVIFDNEEKTTADIARKLCKLHYGVGSDGLITVTKSRVKEAKYRMKFFNPDGTTAEMCGNGIRCFSKYLLDLNLIKANEETTFDTDAGLIRCTIISNNTKKALVKVNMGKPIFYDPKQINVKPVEKGFVKSKIEGFDFTFVSMGNPHAVIFTETADRDVKKFGAVIEQNTTIFPKKTNVEFVKINKKDDLTMYVWERGAGETLACGTGACATFVAATINGYTKDKATIHLLGGDLIIEWNGENSPVYMTGEATNVFKIDRDSLDMYLI